MRRWSKRLPNFKKLMEKKEVIDDIHLFAEKNFMPEVTLFLCAVIEYEDLCRRCSADKQYLAFTKIVQHFIASDSPSEVNISFKMRQKITRLREQDPFTGQDKFFTFLTSQKDRTKVFKGVFVEMETLFWSNVYSRKQLNDNLAQNILDYL